MIYVDSSVALAYLFAENLGPEDYFWDQDLCSSRLFEYEVRVRVNAHKDRDVLIQTTDWLLEQMAFVEMEPTVLFRVTQPFGTQVRTLDAIHLATALYMRSITSTLTIATYDKRLREAAQALGLDIAE